MSSSRSTSPNKNKRPTAKRSPSILVTDSRTDSSKGARAPFAGQKYRKQQHSGDRKKPLARPNKYADISVDKLLSNSSDIPSGQSRLPTSPMLSTSPANNLSRSGSPNYQVSPMESRRSMRSIPKLSQSLPSRTTKTSHKLVLIPDQQRYSSPPIHSPMPQSPIQSPIPQSPMPQSPVAQPQSPGASVNLTPNDLQIQRSKAELMPKERRAQEFSRMTAYFICDEFNLEEVSAFLKQKHEVKPRLYDEGLYVPYALPLISGSDGFRVKSNNSAKLLPNKRYMEKMINKSEQADYFYEYYSGVETPEDANNYSMDPEYENDSAPFDPSEPQFFAPKDDTSGSDNSNKDDGNDKPDSKPEESSPSPTPSTTSPRALNDFSKHHAEMFIFDYGIVVFWNFSETHEKNILADLTFASNERDTSLMVKPIHEEDIETEEFHFEYDNQIHRPRIYNDMITLRSGNHLIKLTMLHAIAQLTKLCLFESRMISNLQLISRIPKKLALTGELGLTRHQLLKRSGKLFKLRADVNLSSSILDTPNFFWSLEPALHPLYNAVRDYLEIDQRVQVINDRCKVFLEFLDIVNDSINEKNTSRITFMIIIIIFLSLLVSLFEFILEFI